MGTSWFVLQKPNTSPSVVNPFWPCTSDASREHQVVPSPIPSNAEQVQLWPAPIPHQAPSEAHRAFCRSRIRIPQPPIVSPCAPANQMSPFAAKRPPARWTSRALLTPAEEVSRPLPGRPSIFEPECRVRVTGAKHGKVGGNVQLPIWERAYSPVLPLACPSPPLACGWRFHSICVDACALPFCLFSARHHVRPASGYFRVLVSTPYRLLIWSPSCRY
jgi:hypothetical protein